MIRTSLSTAAVKRKRQQRQARTKRGQCSRFAWIEQLERRCVPTAVSIVAFHPETDEVLEPAVVTPVNDLNHDGVDDLVLLINVPRWRDDFIAVVFGSKDLPESVEVRRSGVTDTTGQTRGISFGKEEEIFLFNVDLGRPTNSLEIGPISDVVPACGGGSLELRHSFTEYTNLWLYDASRFGGLDGPVAVASGESEYCSQGVPFDFDDNGVEDQIVETEHEVIVSLNSFSRTDYSITAFDRDCCEDDDFRRPEDGIVDVNGDGLPDIVLDRQEVLVNTGSGFEVVDDLDGFNLPNVLRSETWLDFTDNSEAGVHYHQVDINGDDILDSLKLDLDRDMIGVFVAPNPMAVHEFSAPEAWFAPHQVSVSLLDANNDDITDAVFHSPGLFFRPSRTSLFLGIGDGTFVERFTVTTIYRKYFVGAADLSGDENLEFVFRDSTRDGPEVMIYESDPSPSEPLPGDADNNGIVTLADFSIVTENFGKTADALFSDGDFDGNGTVDFDDFLMLAKNFRRFQ